TACCEIPPGDGRRGLLCAGRQPAYSSRHRSDDGIDMARAPAEYPHLARAADANGDLPLERVVALMQKLLSHFDLESVLVEIVEPAQMLFGAEVATLWLYETETERLVCTVPRHEPPIITGPGVGLAGACVTDRAVINVADVTADPRFNRDVDGGGMVDRGSIL